MKKRISRQTPWYCNFNKITKGIFLIFIVLFIAAQVVVDRHLLKQVRGVEDSRIQDLIIDGIRGLRKDAVVDGPSGKVYIPEARLVLPPYPRTLPRILYSDFYDETDRSSEEVEITSDMALGSGIAMINTATTFEAVFEAVPKAQACSRQVVLTFRPLQDREDYRQVFTKKLADGRELFANLTSNCEDSSENLISYLQQVESY